MQEKNVVYSTTKVTAKSLLFRRVQEKNSHNMRYKNIEEHRTMQHKLADIRPVPPNIYAEPTNIGGVPCEWVTRTASNIDKIIIYIHGGSWAFGDLRSARPVAAILAELCDCRILSVDYRLAPEYPYPAGLNDCCDVYCALLDSGINCKNIAIFGDSAGGNIALCLQYLLKARKIPFPAAVACASPVTDLTSYSSLATEKPDLIYTLHEGKEQEIFSLYLNGQNPAIPSVSPVLGEMTGFAPILIHVGEAEALCADNIAFVQAAARQGVDANCKVWREMFHDFSIVGIALKESRESLHEIATFLSQNIGK